MGTRVLAMKIDADQLSIPVNPYDKTVDIQSSSKERKTNRRELRGGDTSENMFLERIGGAFSLSAKTNNPDSERKVLSAQAEPGIMNELGVKLSQEVANKAQKSREDEPYSDSERDAINACIRGDYGNGEERIAKLKEHGFDYERIQKGVNNEVKRIQEQNASKASRFEQVMQMNVDKNTKSMSYDPTDGLLD